MSSKGQSNSLKLAVLIDAENASADVIEPLLEEIGKYGTATIKRVYGDWAKLQLSNWKSKAVDFAIRPMQQCSYATGKNSADIALIIDAMDLLHTQKLDGFCIVSSDSDYTPLAIRMREYGLQVFGFGEKKTKQAFVSACDRFIFTESFKKSDKVVELKPDSQSRQSAPQAARNQAAADQKTSNNDLIKLFTAAYRSAPEKDGWVDLIAFNASLIKLNPSFNSRKQYGKQFKTLIKESGIF
ncbi:MAG: NYN domain-containing protein [Leptolyngbyaceae cyanobacterium SM1_3_5]|nr:NYN domain-containing protein [Leptolyngbyaceae cyanobacterium SM1_3_5]